MSGESPTRVYGDSVVANSGESPTRVYGDRVLLLLVGSHLPESMVIECCCY